MVLVESSDFDAVACFADEVRQVLGLSPERHLQVRERHLPDSVACALACKNGELMILVDEGKPLASDHAIQLLTEITNLVGLLSP